MNTSRPGTTNRNHKPEPQTKPEPQPKPQTETNRNQRIRTHVYAPPLHTPALTAPQPLTYRDRMAFYRCTLLMCAFAAAGCGDDSRPATDTGPRVDTTVTDTGRDAPMGCSGDPDCDDGHDCTIDMCGVGGICRHTPLDERCDDGEMCSLERGCSSGCIDDMDCDDGDFCNGTDRCIAGDCFFVAEADCNDGNECTIDMCSTEVNGCVYETAEGCDAGVIGTDARVPEPFDPDLHFEGTFILIDAPSLGCDPSSYRVSDITFTIVGDDLRATGDRFTLMESPRPDTAAFDVRGSDASCTSVRLQGEFIDSDTFNATWTAGPCRGALTPTGCNSQTISVFGQRIL